MGAENHHEPGPQGPEQQEWQGQRWEYLVLEVVPADPHRLQIKARRVGERLFASGEIVDPIAKSYNKKFEELDKELGNPSPMDYLNFLGSEGWELATSVSFNRLSDWPLLFLKRTATSLK